MRYLNPVSSSLGLYCPYALTALSDHLPGEVIPGSGAAVTGAEHMA